jgi:hypothetical protein
MGFGDSWRGHPAVGATADFIRHLGGGETPEGIPFARIGRVLTAGSVASVAEGAGTGTMDHSMMGHE